MRMIRAVQINPDSIDLAYMDDADVRLRGKVYLTHHLSIEREGNFDDEIETLEAAAEALLTDVLVDFESSPAYDPMLAMRERYGSDDEEDEDND
jgi:hypothetical protein